MTTVLIARSRDGKTERRCDARCHDAKGKKCTCICGGKNHGVGYTTAVDNAFNEDLWDCDFDQSVEIVSLPVQIDLFHGDSK
jgi:hypothetical protein